MSVNRTGLVAIFGVLTLAAALVVSSGALPAQAAPADQTSAQTVSRTITVVGRGEVKVKPDVAVTTVGVEALGATVEAAMEDAQARMASVVAALKQLGIADKDIQTSNFSINFERQSEPASVSAQATPGVFEPPAGFYRVSNMVQVTIRDLNKVSEAIDTSVKAGANNIWGISLALDNDDVVEDQARAAAVADAKARAEALAELSGVAVGQVMAVSEVVGNQGVAMYSVAERAMNAGGTSVEPGELTFTTQIQVVYAIQ